MTVEQLTERLTLTGLNLEEFHAVGDDALLGDALDEIVFFYTNPLGARALYIGSTIYRIHGTNQPWTIGQAMSSGCIRMANEDVMHLSEQVDVGTRVVVTR